MVVVNRTTRGRTVDTDRRRPWDLWYRVTGAPAIPSAGTKERAHVKEGGLESTFTRRFEPDELFAPKQMVVL